MARTTLRVSTTDVLIAMLSADLRGSHGPARAAGAAGAGAAGAAAPQAQPPPESSDPPDLAVGTRTEIPVLRDAAAPPDAPDAAAALDVPDAPTPLDVPDAPTPLDELAAPDAPTAPTALKELAAPAARGTPALPATGHATAARGAMAPTETQKASVSFGGLATPGGSDPRDPRDPRDGRATPASAAGRDECFYRRGPDLTAAERAGEAPEPGVDALDARGARGPQDDLAPAARDGAPANARRMGTSPGLAELLEPGGPPGTRDLDPSELGEVARHLELPEPLRALGDGGLPEPLRALCEQLEVADFDELTALLEQLEPLGA